MYNKNFNSIFSKNLNLVMIETGKKQIDLSRDLNIPKSTVSSWCLGTRLPKLSSLFYIAKYLNIEDPTSLLDENFKSKYIK